ncbi:MAG TPA: protease pro-enzyme activation domain-containing protein, partial [Acidimicrobiales bacterium]|nr:protease pro-enzyme activation domain-containing protein [Acidimicrobiales bacterium]
REMVYVGNAGDTLTGYPVTASGDPTPSISLTEPGNVGSLAFAASGELWVGSGPGAGATSGVLSAYSFESASTGTGEVPIGEPRPALPQGTRDLGPVRGQQPLELVFVLEPQQSLSAAVQQVATPGDPSYKHFLARGAFGPRYGAKPGVISAVVAGLHALGLARVEVDDSDLELSVTTDVAAVERALHVGEEYYELPGDRKVFLPTAAPSLPAEIAPDVQYVLGLDDAVVGHPAGYRSVPSSRPSAARLDSGERRPMGHLSPQACTQAAGAGGETPSSLSDLYGLSSFYQTGDFGQGVTVALFEESDFSDKDVSTYQSCFGTNVTVSRVQLSVGPFGPPSVGNGTDEVTADIEDVIGIAPKASIEVYEAANLPGPMVDEYQRIADDDNAQVVSTSWTLGCESWGLGSFGLWLTKPYMMAEDLIFAQMALQGQTMLASGGDMGSEACGGAGLAVNYPASDPMVTGVGGTELSGSPVTETTWNSTCAKGPCGGGGGISSVWPMPSWQSAPGVPSSLSSGGPCGSSPGFCREVPDVSALAGAPDYLFFCTAGNCSPGGGWSGGFQGTSLSTPLWGAIVALMDSASTAGTEGFLNPLLYSKPSLVNDITTGNNNLGGGADYPATPGYDMASGLGSPNGLALCGLVMGPKCDPLSISPCCTQYQATVGQPFQVTLTATGGAPPYSSWQVTSASFPYGLSLNATTGALSWTPDNVGAGTYSITVSVGDSVGDIATADISITVQLPPPPVVTSLFPPYGPVAGGSRATMNGTGFLGGGLAPSVAFTAGGGASNT